MEPRAIRIDEWLAELAQLERESAEGFSRRDVERVLKITENPAGVRLRQWFDLGAIEYAGRRMAKTIDGRTRYYPVYRVVKKQAARGSRTARACRKKK